MSHPAPIGVGVVGLGLVAQAVHLPVLARSDRFTVAHVCDLSPTLAMAIADELPGAPRASTELDEVLADPSVEAVLLLTPGAHAAEADAALRAGKHVLAEKPLCIAPAEADRLARAASDAGRVLQVGYMKMYDELVEPARAALATLGHVRVARVTVLHPADARQTGHLDIRRATDVDAQLIADADAHELALARAALDGLPDDVVRLYRGVLLGSVVHELSLLRAVGLGLPERFAFAAAWPGPAGDEPPRLHAVGTLPGGAVLELSWHWLPDLPRYAEELSVFGSGGRLTLEMPPPYAGVEPSRLTVERGDAEPLRRESGAAGAFDRALAAFADAVSDGGPVVADAAGAAADTHCLVALAAAVAATAMPTPQPRPRLASAPASFGVGGAPGDGRYSPLSADEVFRAIAEAGYHGAELGPPGLLGSPAEVHARLAAHGLQPVGAYVPLALAGDDAAFEASLDGLATTLAQLAHPGPTEALAILADAGSAAARQRLVHGAADGETLLDDAGWATLHQRLARAIELAVEAGVRTSFHPHLATHVETRAELERLLDGSAVALTLDTAHLALAGIDPVEVVERHGGRVNHVHLKDGRPEALARVRAQGLGDLDVWWPELFCPLGEGAVDAERVVAALVARGYAGWVVVEQDRVPFPPADRARVVAEEAANRRWLATTLDRVVPAHTALAG